MYSVEKRIPPNTLNVYLSSYGDSFDVGRINL